MGRKGDTLLPYEILEVANEELARPQYLKECTAAYVATIRGFIMDFVVRRVVRLRKHHGMFDAQERLENADE